MVQRLEESGGEAFFEELNRSCLRMDASIIKIGPLEPVHQAALGKGYKTMPERKA